MRCIYCDEEKSEDEFSLEHILPQSLVGTVIPELFKTNRVCIRCNSVCGLFVDGIFKKNWFVKNLPSLEAQNYYDFCSKNTKPFPLTYIGKVNDDIPVTKDEECELWLGPCGDTIYHFRSKSDDRYATYAGGDPIKLKSDGGKAFIFFATDNPFWIPKVLFSFYSHFIKAERYTGTIFADLKSEIEFFKTPGENELKIIETIHSFQKQGKQHKAKVSIDTTFELRFLAKVALGVGFNIFKEDFLSTPYCIRLREALWAKTIDQKLQSTILGEGFLKQENEILNKSLRWKGGHTIVLQALGGKLALNILVFGKHLLTICVNDHLPRNQYPDLCQGKVYISIPIRNEFRGPFPLIEYIGQKTNKTLIPELAELENLKNDLTKIPPFRSENYPDLS